jgi:hypothetical protein
VFSLLASLLPSLTTSFVRGTVCREDYSTLKSKAAMFDILMSKQSSVCVHVIFATPADGRVVCNIGDLNLKTPRNASYGGAASSFGESKVRGHV